MSYKISYLEYFLDNGNHLHYTFKFFKVGRIQDIFKKCTDIIEETQKLIENAKKKFPNKEAYLPNFLPDNLTIKQVKIKDININDLFIFSTQKEYFRHVSNTDYKICIEDNNVTFWESYYISNNVQKIWKHETGINKFNLLKYYIVEGTIDKTDIQIESITLNMIEMNKTFKSFDYNIMHHIIVNGTLHDNKVQFNCDIRRLSETEYECFVYMPNSNMRNNSTFEDYI